MPAKSSRDLQSLIFVIGQGDGLSPSQFLLVLLHQVGIDCDLSRCQGGGGNELERGVSDEFPRQPEEWFFEVVVRLGRNFEVLDVSSFGGKSLHRSSLFAL